MRLCRDVAKERLGDLYPRSTRGSWACSRSAGSEAVNYASSWSRPAVFISSINLSVKPSLALRPLSNRYHPSRLASNRLAAGDPG